MYKTKIQTEKDVINFVIEKYALSMGIEQANKETIEDIIGKEVYTLIFDNVKQEILNINIAYLKINNSIRNNEKKIDKYTKYINKQNAIKNKFKNLNGNFLQPIGKKGRKKKITQRIHGEITDLRTTISATYLPLNALISPLNQF